MISNKYHLIHRYYIFHSKSMCYHKCREPSLLAWSIKHKLLWLKYKTRVSLLTYGGSSSKPYTPIFNYFYFVQAIAKFYHCLTIEINYQLSLVIVLLILRLYSCSCFLRENQSKVKWGEKKIPRHRRMQAYLRHRLIVLLQVGPAWTMQRMPHGGFYMRHRRIEFFSWNEGEVLT